MIGSTPKEIKCSKMLIITRDKRKGVTGVIKSLKNNIYFEFAAKIIKIMGLSFALFFLIKNFFN